MGFGPSGRPIQPECTSALLRGLLSVAVWSLYAVAFFAPVLKADEGGHACTAIRLGTLPGWETLLFGWMPPLSIPWSANLLLLMGWIALLCGRYRSALWLGVAAALWLWVMRAEFPDIAWGNHTLDESEVIELPPTLCFL